MARARLRRLPAVAGGAERLGLAGPAQLQGKRIATSYPALTCAPGCARRAWMPSGGADAVVRSRSPRAWARPMLICDLVSSGATLAANQLKPVCDLLRSEAVLAGPARASSATCAPEPPMLLRRIDGVLRIRDSKLLMFQAPRDAVPDCCNCCRMPNRPTVSARSTATAARLAGAVPRRGDLAAAGRPEARRCARADGAAGGEDAGMKRIDWNALDEARAKPCCAPGAGGGRCGARCASRRSSPMWPRAAMMRCACSPRALRRRRAGDFEVSAAEFAAAGRGAGRTCNARRCRSRIAHRGVPPRRHRRTVCARDRAGRASASACCGRSRASACTCRPAARRCRRPR
jgi:hypothetical protein